MATPKRILGQIAASAPPELKLRLAGKVLYELATSNSIDCFRSLREAAISTALTATDSKTREAAMEILEELGNRGQARIYEEVSELTGRMLETFAELSVVGRLASGKMPRLLESTALMHSFDDSSQERAQARSILSQRDPAEVSRTLDTLVDLGMVDSGMMPEYLELLDDLSCPEPNRAGPTPSDFVPIKDQSKLKEALALAVERSSIPPEESPSEDCPEPHLEPARPRPKKKKKKSETPLLPWDERWPVPETTDASELRNAELTNRSASEMTMYRIICVFCFRITGQKALIGENYANVSVVKSNVRRVVQGDQAFLKFFEECWGRMAAAGALQFKKRKEVVSLPSSVSGISDTMISAAVSWALNENRRLRC